MSSGRAYVVLGFGVTRTTFFTTKDVGIQCPKGHRPKEGSGKFCGDCGGRFQDSSKEVATPDFEAWCKKLGFDDPAEVWDMLCEYEGGLAVADTVKDAELYAELGVHHVGAIESSERKSTFLALGFRLTDQGDERNGSRNDPNTYRMEDVIERLEFLNDVAQKLKVAFLLPVKLHLIFYWSV